MFSAPRSPKSFGVSGLLLEDSRVYYENLFSTRHVGRVTDLLAAKLQGPGIDELRFRALLLFGMFEAYRSQAGESGAGGSFPIVLECGVDAEKVALGFSFHFAGARAGAVPAQLEGLMDRVLVDGAALNAFEQMLGYCVRHADRVVVRSLPDFSRIEVVLLLALGADAAVDEDERFEWVTLALEELEDAPPPKEFVSLGDLDFRTLLKDERPGAAQAARADSPRVVAGPEASAEAERAVAGSATGAEVARAVAGSGTGPEAARAVAGAKARPEAHTEVAGEGPQPEERHEVRGEPAEPESIAAVVARRQEEELQRRKVSGGEEQARRTVVVGGGPAPEDELVVVGGHAEGQRKIVVEGSVDARNDEAQTVGGQEDGDNPTFVISGGPQEQTVARENEVLVTQLRQYQVRVSELERRLAEAQGRALAQAGERRPEGDGSAQQGSRFGELLRKAWPFNRRGDGSRQEIPQTGYGSGPAPARQGGEAAGAPEGTGAESQAAAIAAAAESATAATPSDAGQLIAEIQNAGIAGTVNKAAVEAATLKAELGSQRAQRWVEGLMGELVAEKGRLHEMAQKLSQSIRAREYQYKNREQALLEELKHRDEQVKQKEALTLRLREQLSEATMAVERLKASAKSSSESAQSKHKFAMVQRLLESTKVENADLKSKLEEVRAQLSQAHQAPKSAAVVTAELASLRGQTERLTRQMDELRRQNRQLADKLTMTRKERTSTGSSLEDMKRRLEAAMSQSSSAQKENDELRLRVEELQREEARLRMELNRTQAEARAARKGPPGGGGTPPSGNPQAA